MAGRSGFSFSSAVHVDVRSHRRTSTDEVSFLLRSHVACVFNHSKTRRTGEILQRQPLSTAVKTAGVDLRRESQRSSPGEREEAEIQMSKLGKISGVLWAGRMVKHVQTISA